MLGRLNQEFGKTIVMVTHDPLAAKAASHVRYLEKGTLLPEGQSGDSKTCWEKECDASYCGTGNTDVATLSFHVTRPDEESRRLDCCSA